MRLRRAESEPDPLKLTEEEKVQAKRRSNHALMAALMDARMKRSQEVFGPRGD